MHHNFEPENGVHVSGKSQEHLGRSMRGCPKGQVVSGARMVSRLPHALGGSPLHGHGRVRQGLEGFQGIRAGTGARLLKLVTSHPLSFPGLLLAIFLVSSFIAVIEYTQVS